MRGRVLGQCAECEFGREGGEGRGSNLGRDVEGRRTRARAGSGQRFLEVAGQGTLCALGCLFLQRGCRCCLGLSLSLAVSTKRAEGQRKRGSRAREGGWRRGRWRARGQPWPKKRNATREGSNPTILARSKSLHYLLPPLTVTQSSHRRKHARRAVVRAAQHLPAVGREAHVLHSTLVPSQLARDGARAQVTQAHAPVEASSRDHCGLVRVPSEARDSCRVLDGCAGGEACACVPNTKKSVEPCGGGQRDLPSWAKACGFDRGGVACLFVLLLVVLWGWVVGAVSFCGGGAVASLAEGRRTTAKVRARPKKKREGIQTRLKLGVVCTLRRVNGVLSI